MQTLQTTFPPDMCPTVQATLLAGMHFDAKKRPTLQELSLSMEEELGRVASNIAQFSALSGEDDYSDGDQ